MKEKPVQDIEDKMRLRLTIDYIIDHLDTIGYTGIANSIIRDKPFTAVLFNKYSQPYIVIDYTKPMTNKMNEYNKRGTELYKTLNSIDGVVN